MITVESSFALVKRGVVGVCHSASKENLRRYLAHYRGDAISGGEAADAQCPSISCLKQRRRSRSSAAQRPNGSRSWIDGKMP